MADCLWVHWQPVVCVVPTSRGKGSVFVDAAASLGECQCRLSVSITLSLNRSGINIQYTPQSSITHQLTQTYTLNTTLMTSLLSAAQLVKQEWLTEYIRLGTSQEDADPLVGCPLEYTFSPPPETKYRPAFSPALSDSLKSFKIWEPDDQRIGIFRGFRFILAGERDKEITNSIRDLVVAGEGDYEVFNVLSGESRWHQVLARSSKKMADAGSSGKGVLVIADEETMNTALGMEQWQSFVNHARRYESTLSPNTMY